MNEFELIRTYFHFSAAEESIPLGVGDDCALVDIPPDRQLAITTDTLVSGVHFPADGDPGLIARRALRVNLSDLAAMGARPLGFQLALTLPELDSDWVADFSRGLALDARDFDCPLLGGDTTRGPLAITITALGTVPRHRALLRSGARAGDLVYVTGSLGDGAGGLHCLADAGDDYLVNRYWLPQPRLEVGQALIGIASAAVDVSDGLVQDLGHIAAASGLAARLQSELLPIAPQLLARGGEARAWALGGGDDYELCFTVPPSLISAMEFALVDCGIAVTRVGQMLAASGGATGVHCVDASGNPLEPGVRGYDHFR